MLFYDSLIRQEYGKNSIFLILKEVFRWPISFRIKIESHSGEAEKKSRLKEVTCQCLVGGGDGINKKKELRIRY